VSQQQRAKYIREEEEAQYKSKKSKGFFEHSSQSHAQRTPSASSHGSGYGGTGTNISLRRRTISDFLDEGCRNDVDSKVYGFSMHVGYHSMFFAHLIGMKWFLP
jgi:hypothetical protein